MANEAQIEIIGTVAEIDGLIDSLRTYCDNMFGIDPDAADWGDVGSVKRVRELLAQAVAFIEGTEP